MFRHPASVLLKGISHHPGKRYNQDDDGNVNDDDDEESDEKYGPELRLYTRWGQSGHGVNHPRVLALGNALEEA